MTHICAKMKVIEVTWFERCFQNGHTMDTTGHFVLLLMWSEIRCSIFTYVVCLFIAYR